MGIAVAPVSVAQIALLDALHAGELLALAQRDECYALGGAPHFADLRHRGADEDAAGGDEHHLVLLLDEHRADDRAVALGDLDCDHALSAAPVARVVAHRRALAVAVRGRGEHGARLILGGEHAHHALAFAQAHAAHAGRLAAHRPHVA